MLLGRVCVFLRMGPAARARFHQTGSADLGCLSPSQPQLQGRFAGLDLLGAAPAVRAPASLKAQGLGHSPRHKVGPGIPWRVPCAPPAASLSSPGFSWTGLWSGASERKALMKWGPREQPPHRGPALGNCFLASLLSEAAEGLRACCCLPGEELWGTGHSSAFFCACLWK